MGKRLRQQRRGKGTTVFTRPSWRFKAKVKLIAANQPMKGEIVDIINDPARSAPLMVVRYENGSVAYLPAFYGAMVGQQVGYLQEPAPGSVMMLKDIPEGTDIYNIEIRPGDGGKLVRAAGSSAKVVSREADKVIVRLPSKEFKALHPNCRAIVGVIAGAGRKDKPIIKAGKKFHMMKARNKYWPKVSAVKMNAREHPFGGKRKRTGRIPKTVSRHAPPGRKVGSIAAKRTGVRK